jgi:hypothetical protein
MVTRLFKRISFSLDIRPTLYCDNQQTVGIINKTENKINTRMRHADTHQMWLRQEAAAGHIHVSWLATSQLLADGLTKSLPRQKHAIFIEQLGLVDVSSQLKQSDLQETDHLGDY